MIREAIAAVAIMMTACGGTAQDAPQSSEEQANPFTVVQRCDAERAGLLSTPPAPPTAEECHTACAPFLAEIASSGTSDLPPGLDCTGF